MAPMRDTEYIVASDGKRYPAEAFSYKAVEYAAACRMLELRLEAIDPKDLYSTAHGSFPYLSAIALENLGISKKTGSDGLVENESGLLYVSPKMRDDVSRVQLALRAFEKASGPSLSPDDIRAAIDQESKSLFPSEERLAGFSLALDFKENGFSTDCAAPILYVRLSGGAEETSEPEGEASRTDLPEGAIGFATYPSANSPVSSIVPSVTPPASEGLKDMLLELRRRIHERSFEALLLRNGIRDGKCLTLEEIGQNWGGISRERVRQIESRGKGELEKWVEEAKKAPGSGYFALKEAIGERLSRKHPRSTPTARKSNSTFYEDWFEPFLFLPELQAVLGTPEATETAALICAIYGKPGEYPIYSPEYRFFCLEDVTTAFERHYKNYPSYLTKDQAGWLVGMTDMRSFVFVGPAGLYEKNEKRGIYIRKDRLFRDVLNEFLSLHFGSKGAKGYNVSSRDGSFERFLSFYEEDFGKEAVDALPDSLSLMIRLLITQKWQKICPFTYLPPSDCSGLDGDLYQRICAAIDEEKWHIASYDVLYGKFKDELQAVGIEDADQFKGAFDRLNRLNPKYRTDFKEFFDPKQGRRANDVIKSAISEFDGPFSFDDVCLLFPNLSPKRIESFFQARRSRDIAELRWHKYFIFKETDSDGRENYPEDKVEELRLFLESLFLQNPGEGIPSEEIYEKAKEQRPDLLSSLKGIEDKSVFRAFISWRFLSYFGRNKKMRLFLRSKEVSGAWQQEIDRLLINHGHLDLKEIASAELYRDVPAPNFYSIVLYAAERGYVRVSETEIYSAGNLRIHDGFLSQFFENLEKYLLEHGEWRSEESSPSLFPKDSTIWENRFSVSGLVLAFVEASYEVEPTSLDCYRQHFHIRKKL